ncbi:MAG: hypothetical protein ABSH51_05870 [Solirubrobacteraceae bacterium]
MTAGDHRYECACWECGATWTLTRATDPEWLEICCERCGGDDLDFHVSPVRTPPGPDERGARAVG